MSEYRYHLVVAHQRHEELRRQAAASRLRAQIKREQRHRQRQR